MFQRFTSALFGDDMEELSQCSRPGDSKGEEEEEDWILVNYLAEACSGQRGDGLSGSTVNPQEEEEEEDELVMIPSPVASPPIRYASCTSLNSTADTDPDGGAEEDEEDDEEESGFLRVDACSLEESWFVTPPPCFTGRGSQPILLETSPLENLLIEHPSMSVYAHHSPPRIALDPLPRSLDLDLGLLSENMPAAPGGKEKARRTLDGPRHRQDVAVVQRRSSLHSSCYAAGLSTRSSLLQQRRVGEVAQLPPSLHSSCYAAGLSTRSSLLQQRPVNATQRTQPLSRNALRRLNLLHPPKVNTTHLHQPSQRHLNF
uniref:tumor protein p53-inducible nuclear protein 1 n=1 Tax=Monopterus albus TaxID=43700 RepID=UPI0009B355E4|nr:tumor protein p53-inducible nuclear protein 1 [Monopterus albus]